MVQSLARQRLTNHCTSDPTHIERNSASCNTRPLVHRLTLFKHLDNSFQGNIMENEADAKNTFEDFAALRISKC